MSLFSNENGGIVFEAFEASPLGESVLKSTNTLLWDFPGSSVVVPLKEFLDEDFQQNLVSFLDQASIESAKQFTAHTTKAGASILESRETVNPALITQMLMALLSAVGRRVELPRIRKRVRDDVCWEDAALPWRRSPFWLVLRVSLQRMLYNQLGNEKGRIQYKFLMAITLADLLVDSAPRLSPEQTSYLKAKLCRRLSKLEVEKSTSPSFLSADYFQTFAATELFFTQSIQQAVDDINSTWTKFKKTIRRQIPNLPLRAAESDLKLSLPESYSKLHAILNLPIRPRSRFNLHSSYSSVLTEDATTPSIQSFKKFSNRYNSLTALEVSIEAGTSTLLAGATTPEEYVIRIANRITGYIDTVGAAYNTSPVEQSGMILNVFALWVSMDLYAVRAFPLLKEYHPGFSPDLLDSLQLPRWKDMCRLQEVQTYLNQRCAAATSHMTIFIDPSDKCFAARFYDCLEKNSVIQGLHDRIQEASDVSRAEKQFEWKSKTATYDDNSQKILRTFCTGKLNPDGSHDIRGCTRCFLVRSRKRLRISVHEAFLPSNKTPDDIAQRKAIVFELNMPKAFALYRDVSWKIVKSFARKRPAIRSTPPKMLLRKYRQLLPFMESNETTLVLASTTKSFLLTHFSDIRLPVDFKKVDLPLGLHFSYYDVADKFWSSELKNSLICPPGCAMTIPSSSPFNFIHSSRSFPPKGNSPKGNSPSSYEIIASQSKCPTQLTIHEFIAYQNLFSGKTTRWPKILVELGSSNLNFGSEETMLLFSQLALQAGPAHEDNFRLVHATFHDEDFCKKLANKIDQLLDIIAPNGREAYCMDMLLTLALRIWELGRSGIRSETAKLLHKMRTITLHWISALRIEVRDEAKADTADIASTYAFLASLLCRRTFVAFIEGGDVLSAEDTCCFIRASLAFQENLIDDSERLSGTAHAMLLRDTKMVYRMRSIIRRSVECHSASLGTAIRDIWFEATDALREYSPWCLLSGENDGWVTAVVLATEYTAEQSVHYHLFEGHLFVDGKPLGKLPAEIRNSEVLKELFGNQHLRTFPSALAGMTYVLDTPVGNHQIHLGYCNKKLVVRASIRGALIQYVERSTFWNDVEPDLPEPLVQNCHHWLNLRSGVLDIRPQRRPWKSQAPRNWLLDIHTRRARRGCVSLVDPHGRLFQQIAGIFGGFEDMFQLTVFQPLKRNLTVELKRLDLRFEVNYKHLLWSNQLRSEIDPYQDVGTWYGLEAMIVLRNLKERSVIIPVGTMTYSRRDFHVSIRAVNYGGYCKYTVDNILGRLQCPPEPLLIYRKALLHALTSFVLPDPLTGQTGTEAAMHCLRSGLSQPWTALDPNHTRDLVELANLTPKRQYYPRELFVQQKVFWNPNLTVSIQHDGFREAVGELLMKSKRLSRFTGQKVEREPPNVEDAHLRQRSRFRRSVYERLSGFRDENLAADAVYEPRHHLQTTKGVINVYHTVQLIRDRPASVHTAQQLTEKLTRYRNIGGYTRTFYTDNLSNLLEMNFGLKWGPLVNFCRNSNPNQLIFQLGVIAFGKKVDMEIVRTLVAFSIFDELKTLELPLLAPSFVHFQANEQPNATMISSLVDSCAHPFVRPSHLANNKYPTAKQTREINVAKEDHQSRITKESREFTDFLLAQWPCEEPSKDGITVTALNIEKAMTIINPEWFRLFCNFKFWEHTKDVQKVLNMQQGSVCEVLPPDFHQNPEIILPLRHRKILPTLAQDLIQKAGPPPFATAKPSMFGGGKSDLQVAETNAETLDPLHPKRELDELGGIITELAASDNPLRQQYSGDLMQSLSALRQLKTVPGSDNVQVSQYDLEVEVHRARQAVADGIEAIRDTFAVGDPSFRWLRESNLWPCITPVTLLEQLRSTTKNVFGSRMKESIIEYGVSVTILQRLLRMEDSLLDNDTRKLREELKNAGHSDWNPARCPDWLLLEIDANILIRSEQVGVAVATISPKTKSNSVLQMNMGQGKPLSRICNMLKVSNRFSGKTSCIMPMVAAVLANGKSLTRLTVPMALLLQTAQILQSRLGGLLGREIRHIPFSRGTGIDLSTIEAYRTLHEEVLNGSGVILALPEHLLSFKLSGLQCLSDSRHREAGLMIGVQTWLTRISRDVLDECDFTLAVKTQLIYPSGSQTSVDGHPFRWEIAQSVLSLAETHLWKLRDEYPNSVEVVKKPDAGFPVFYFLRKDAETALVARLVDEICAGNTPVLPMQRYTAGERDLVKAFISAAKVDRETVRTVTIMFLGKPSIAKKLLLLRGLFVHNILLLCLKKRWNVQYGLHPAREPVAVPFRAKAVPDDRSEWGHPDVSIIFTCLAFYYGGLEKNQLQQALGRVLRSDDPSVEYDRWTHDTVTLPEPLRHWNVLNVDDEGQVMEILQHLRFSVVVINYYLNHFVFPLYARQFKIKLQASGWDIPLFLPHSRPSASRTLTTGFSGTNDNRRLLPLTIRQDDLPSLSHTNAEVLTYLLQPRNRKYEVAADGNGKRLSEHGLLQRLKDTKTRILIDAGAHILEMDNRTLVKAWLDVDHEAQAAVYFDQYNKAWVHYRNSQDVPLLRSPLADNFDQCLVYIDEAHTRGTDLKLPDGARGALTLEMGQTKDQTVQGTNCDPMFC